VKIVIIGNENLKRTMLEVNRRLVDQDFKVINSGGVGYDLTKLPPDDQTIVGNMISTLVDKKLSSNRCVRRKAQIN